MRAILVSVDYSDLLQICLPYNRKHFSDVCVVTTPGSKDAAVAAANNCCVFETDLFYADGAVLNKWRALEAGLDAFGREGWMCLMDADVLWPKGLEFLEGTDDCSGVPFLGIDYHRLNTNPLGVRFFNANQLLTPMRRMWTEWPHTPLNMQLVGSRSGELPCERCDWLPTESDWSRFPLHPQQREWAGYTQIFHCSDPALGHSPWHETDWRHAGGADSFFQAKWPQEQKVRPPFEVLHLGPAGQNWCGRATPYADGTVHPQADARKQQLHAFIRERRTGGFRAEKL